MPYRYKPVSSIDPSPLLKNPQQTVTVSYITYDANGNTINNSLIININYEFRASVWNYPSTRVASTYKDTVLQKDTDLFGGNKSKIIIERNIDTVNYPYYKNNNNIEIYKDKIRVPSDY